VFLFARYGAGITAYALLQIYHHSKSGHVLLLRCIHLIRTQCPSRPFSHP
jgi:hypothetical protein